MRTRAVLAAAAAAALSVTAVAPPAAGGGDFDAASSQLAEDVRQAVLEAGFDSLVDFDRVQDGQAQEQESLPSVDVAVIALAADGGVQAAANVLYDRDHPGGYVAEVGRGDLAAGDVRFSEWDLERFDDENAWQAGPGPEEVLSAPPGWQPSSGLDWMAPYPASVLKVMVAYSVLRAVDDGAMSLGAKVNYQKVRGQGCGADPSKPRGFKPRPKSIGATTVADWLDQMITVSDNYATCVLLQQLYHVDRLEESNAHFAEIGLSTLRMQPLFPDRGTGWLSGTMTMGALDTARLLLLASGATGDDGVLWTTAAGREVSPDELSVSSREHLLRLLSDQSFNEVLNPVNLCGSPDATPGIPSTVSPRWVDPVSGTVVTYDGSLVIDFGYDVRPCTDRAEVSFAHKTGLISVSGADAGIVRALPGQDGRWYVVAVQSSVGYRFGDPENAASSPNACEDAPYVCYPKPFGALGAAIDEAVASLA